MSWPVVKALLGHYHRHPFQVILVALGLILGVSLLVGVTAINNHAKQSYENGDQLFSSPIPYLIRTTQPNGFLPKSLYSELRDDAFDQCTPFDVVSLRTKGGEELNVVGVDPVFMMRFNQKFEIPGAPHLPKAVHPFPILVSEEFAHFMGWTTGYMVHLDDESLIGPVIIDEDKLLNSSQIVADIDLLRRLQHNSDLTLIGCGEMSVDKLTLLKARLPDGVMLTRNSRAELESITQAFHMNLKALGMLSFLVGLFIFYQAISLSMIQRQTLVGSMRQLGVSSLQLAKAMMIELSILVSLCWFVGNVFGLILANQLIPSVSSGLGYMYGASMSLDVRWTWETGIYSWGLTCLGSALACAWPLVRLLRSQPIRLTSKLSLVRFAGREFTLQAALACVFTIAAIAIFQAPESYESGFAIIALMLLSVAMFTPFLLWHLFQSFSFSLRWVKVRWFFADAAASMGYRGVATMAFMLSMAANIGVETLVGSFRHTTDDWLTQKLASDVYVYPYAKSAPTLSRWLKAQPEVEDVWWRWERDVATNLGQAQVVSTGTSKGEHDALAVKLGIPKYWQNLHYARGVMVSESMSLKLDIRPGDYIDLGAEFGDGWLVTGVYYDYGNPFNQVVMSHRNWLAAYEGQGNITLGVNLTEGGSKIDLRRRLFQNFDLGSDRVVNNKTIHTQALTAFDRTFIIADTIGNITLIIAIVGIFFATLAGESSRQKQFSLLRCFGISGKELIFIGGLQLLVFGLISILIAVPLGLTLAQLVVDIIIRQSFGWTLQLYFEPAIYLNTLLLALFALVIAGILPVARLLRLTPIESLRDSL
ncbi:ABC transporter permease [Vibrio sp. FNV 38]|nr:ABC transporter permease [Vibrio sp. FNV 38]